MLRNSRQSLIKLFMQNTGLKEILHTVKGRTLKLSFQKKKNNNKTSHKSKKKEIIIN